MKLPFKISLRFLGSSKGQTLLIAVGIAIGVSVQIFIGSLISSLQTSLVNKTIGNSPEIKISSTADDKLINDYTEIQSEVENTNSNISNLSFSADNPASIKTNDNTYSVLLRGMNIDDSDKIYNVKERIYEGNETKNGGYGRWRADRLKRNPHCFLIPSSKRLHPAMWMPSMRYCGIMSVTSPPWLPGHCMTKTVSRIFAWMRK